MTTLDELEKLLAAATPGPWKIERGKRCIQGPDTREGDPLVLTSMMGGATKWSHSPYSEYCVPGMKEGDANAALICAAVNALPELLAKVKRYEETLQFIAREQSAATATEAADKFQAIARAALNQEPGTTEVFQELAKKQEPLGAEFEAAIGDRSTLYET